jgi:putative acetyltransferase
MIIHTQSEEHSNEDVVKILQKYSDFCTSSEFSQTLYLSDSSELTTPENIVFATRFGEEIVGVGEIRLLNETHIELKSVYVLEEFRRNGVGGAIIKHIMTLGKDAGYTKITVETGKNNAFDSAREFFKFFNFDECKDHEDHVVNQDNICMTRSLLTY